MADYLGAISAAPFLHDIPRQAVVFLLFVPFHPLRGRCRFKKMMVLASAVLASATLSAALFGGAAAEDVLHSKRMQKRHIDADGNYNICT